MTKSIPLIIFSLLLFISFATPKESAYSISIEQDGKTFVIADSDTLQLQRKPFTIRVSLVHLEGIYLNASLSPSYYLLADNQPIPDWKYIESKAFADAAFNPEKELLIADDGFNYWFHDPELEWNRFDPGIVVEKDSVIGFRTVARFWDADADEPIKLKDVKKLYLFSFYRSENKDPERCEARQRRKALIRFI